MAIQWYRWRLLALVFLVVVLVALLGLNVVLSLTHHAFTLGHTTHALHKALDLTPDSVWHV